MWDSNRIDKFTAVLNYIWKTKCPDWRFGRLIENTFSWSEHPIESMWFSEDDLTIKIICDAFNLELEDVLTEIHWKDGDEELRE